MSYYTIYKAISLNTGIKTWDIHISIDLKYMTVVVGNICATSGGNKAGTSPLTGNSCVERHVHSCKMISGSV